MKLVQLSDLLVRQGVEVGNVQLSPVLVGALLDTSTKMNKMKNKTRREVVR